MEVIAPSKDFELAPVNVAAVVSKLGFVVCEWGPEESDKCENCEELGKQLYFSGPTDAGTYLCLDCIMAMDKENEAYGKAIDEIEKAGHTSHCAARQVWGDGECECELKGIIPGPISRMMCGCQRPDNRARRGREAN